MSFGNYGDSQPDVLDEDMPLVAPYQFQVHLWLEADPELGVFGKATWVEFALCKTEFRAKKVAGALAAQGEAVQVSQLEEGIGFVPYLWIPDNPETQGQ